MKISILCSEIKHPIYPYLERWKSQHQKEHEVELVQKKCVLSGGDILFLISCHEIVGRETREQYKAVLVIHASDLPAGRGWSPHIWQILAGQNDIVVTLLEAEDLVDSGAIWAQEQLHFKGHELLDEMNAALFNVEFKLMDYAIDRFHDVQPRQQDRTTATSYRRRTPEDSRIDPNISIAEQFNLLRVADPVRSPAFFEHLGCRYIIRLEKDKGGNQ